MRRCWGGHVAVGDAWGLSAASQSTYPATKAATASELVVSELPSTIEAAIEATAVLHSKRRAKVVGSVRAVQGRVGPFRGRGCALAGRARRGARRHQ